MSNTAEGGSDGIVAKGPSNVYPGVNPCSGMDGNTDINFGSVAPIDHDAPDYPDSITTGTLFGPGRPSD